MRRNGKTTRTIDAAIQAIFNPKNEGRIIVPNNVQETKGFKPSQIVKDQDWYLSDGVQNYLRRRIFERLSREHPNVIVAEIGNVIEITPRY